MVTLDTTTNLTAAPTWTYRLDSGAWVALPATRTIQVPINQTPGIYVYNHSAEARAQVTVGDLDYWVPGTPAFTTAQAMNAIALRQPNNAGNAIISDYENAGNIEGTGSASINFGGLVAGNGWLYMEYANSTRGSPPDCSSTKATSVQTTTQRGVSRASSGCRRQARVRV